MKLTREQKKKQTKEKVNQIILEVLAVMRRAIDSSVLSSNREKLQKALRVGDETLSSLIKKDPTNAHLYRRAGRELIQRLKE